MSCFFRLSKRRALSFSGIVVAVHDSRGRVFREARYLSMRSGPTPIPDAAGAKPGKHIVTETCPKITFHQDNSATILVLGRVRSLLVLASPSSLVRSPGNTTNKAVLEQAPSPKLVVMPATLLNFFSWRANRRLLSTAFVKLLRSTATF